MTESIVYTVGHSNVSFEALLAILQRAGITCLVDIRTTPFSRYTPQFNQNQLRPLLEKAGIQYIYEGQDLGGRPSDPTCYKNGSVADDDANFLKKVDYHAVEQRAWFQQGLDRLVGYAQRQATTIMCSEGNPHECHRHHLIALALLSRGVIVQHLRADPTQDEILHPGAGPKEQLSLF